MVREVRDAIEGEQVFGGERERGGGGRASSERDIEIAGVMDVARERGREGGRREGGTFSSFELDFLSLPPISHLDPKLSFYPSLP